MPSGRRQRLDEADVEYKLPKLREAEAEAEGSKVKSGFTRPNSKSKPASSPTLVLET